MFSGVLETVTFFEENESNIQYQEDQKQYLKEKKMECEEILTKIKQNPTCGFNILLLLSFISYVDQKELSMDVIIS
jgi:hypothetical protein